MVSVEPAALETEPPGRGVTQDRGRSGLTRQGLLRSLQVLTAGAGLLLAVSAAAANQDWLEADARRLSEMNASSPNQTICN